MEREFDIAGMGAIGALLKRKAKHRPEPGTLCPNCGTELVGFYCHVCGQSTHDQHRSIWHLMWEGIEGFTHLDGRLGQTLPPLFFNPGKLARDHLEGRRARHVPPFRLFLISLLIFMFVLEGLFHGATKEQNVGAEGRGAAQSGKTPDGDAAETPDPDQTMIDAQKTVAQAKATLASPRAPPPVPPAPAHDGAPSPQSDVVTFKTHEENGRLVTAAEEMDRAGKGSKVGFEGWLKEHIKRAAANREYYTMVLFTWAHRLAIMLLPILAMLLALVYVRRRKQFYIYDHLIVSMQFLSFEFLLFAVAWIIPDPIRPWALLIATVWTPVNLYMILRGAYGSRVITAGLKAVLIWFSTVFLFGLLMTGLLTLALAEM